jgi:hypothetical protein
VSPWQWGNRGVWSDVDHVELQKQKAKGYGRYMTAEGRQNLAEMSMTRYGPRNVQAASFTILGFHLSNHTGSCDRGKGCGYSSMHHELWRHWGPTTELHGHLPPSGLIIGGRLM